MYIHMFTTASALRCREKESDRAKEEEGGIIRPNDKKGQCCDSEQLVFPSVDRRLFLCVCVRTCVCLMETDWAVIVHF